MKKCLIFLVSLFLMIGTMWAQTFPETSTADAPKYYTIASYNRGGYLTNVGEGRGVEHIDVTKGSLWYFTQADENGGVHFCNYAGGYLAADKTVSETAGVWYVLSNGVNTNGVSISSTNPISNSSCVDANNYNSGVGTWHPSANDWEGTTWVFAEVTDFSTIFNVDGAKASAKAEIDVLASVSGNYPDATEVKERIDNINVEGTSPVQYEAAIATVNQCVADYKDAVLQALDGKYFTINTPARDNGFMKVVGNQVVGVAEASSSAAIWQFEYTDGAVRVLNPQTGKYLCEPGDYSANVAVTENAAEAGVYQLVVNRTAANDAAKVKLTSNGKSIHMGGNSVLVRWDDGGASEWTIAEVEVDITKDITALLEANADNHAEMPALGQYSTAGYTALQDALNTVTTLKQAADAVAAFEATKCLPVFTIDGVWGYALGMSIYESESGSLLWRETDRTESMLWSFDMTDTIAGVTDKVVVKNLATGNLFWGASFIQVTETSESIADDGVFLFYTEGTGDPVHADQAGQSIVRWNNLSANSASAWRFTFAGTTYGINDLPEVPDTPVVPDTPEGVVNNLASADPAKCYSITTMGRGGWTVDAAGTSFTCTTAEGLTVDESDPRQQFAILSLNAQDYYLYSVSAKKFVKRDGSLVAGMADAIEFVDASSMDAGRVMVRFDEDHIINVSDASRRMEINNWSSLDEGNAVVITEAGDFDATEALAMLAAEPEEEEFACEIVYPRGPEGWIEGADWHNVDMRIMGYSSPIYHFAGKVETFRIIVKSSKNNQAFFSLSELELYDADGQKIPLTAANVASNADHNTLNPESLDGGGFAALFDEDLNTYFHSAWQNMPIGEHYLEVTLPDGGYDTFSFTMLSRSNSDGWDQSHTFPGEMMLVSSVELSSIEIPEVPEIPGDDDEPVESLTALSDADPTKCYSVTTNGRGGWAVNAEGTLFSSTSTEGLSVDTVGDYQKFAILSANGEDYYLYSVSAKKFVTKEGTLVPFVGDAIVFADASSVGAGRVQVRFRDYSNGYINLGNQGQMVIDNWSTLDAGNAVLIAEAGDFDAAEALAILADPEGTKKNYLVAQAQELLAANASNHAVRPALGQYGTEAYENLAAIVVSDTATAASVEHLIAAFEASKCLPVFTIDGVNDYAAGMSIYDDEGQYLRWKATDRSDESMLWSFDMTDTIVGVTDKVVIKNLATGNLFMGNPPYEASYLRVAETTEDIADDGLFLMFREEDTEYAIWASQTGMVVPSQGIFSANSTSAWKFTYAGTTYRINELPEEETPQGVISSLSAADPTKCYTISTATRGAWAINDDGTYFSTTGIEGYVVDAKDARQQFAILSANGEDYYLYSVSAKKFVKCDRSLVTGVADALEFVDASSKGEGRVMVRFRDFLNSNINIGGDNQMVINGWNLIDEGNAVLIAEADDFDATEALAILANPEEAERNALIAQALELLEANADNHAVEPALGQYATRTYEYLDSVVNSEEVTKNVIEDAISLFEASKCLPVFTINGVADFVAGKSIYEFNGRLYWTATDRTDESMLWMFDMTDTIVGVTDKVVVKNLATGRLFDNALFVQVAEPQDSTEGYWICPEGLGVPMFAYEDGRVERAYSWTSDSPHTWEFVYAGTTYDINELPSEPETPDTPDNPAPGESYMAPLAVKGKASSVVNIPIVMENSSEVVGFQFDLYLPEGVTVVSTTEDDETLYDITFNKERVKSSHVIDAELQEDGALRIFAFSTVNAAFVGNSGVVLEVAVNVGDLGDGEYPVIIRGIRMSAEDGTEEVCLDHMANLFIENTLMGDVNGDGKHTMSDVVMIINAVLEREQANFDENAADMNGDGVITVGDAISVLRLAMGADAAKAPARTRNTSRREVVMPVLDACELSTMGNGRVVLPVALNNSEAYSAFQLDVVLPEGVELAEATLTSRAKASHAVAWNALSDGTTRVVAYALENAAFRGNEGALLNLVLNVSDAQETEDAELSLANARFATVDGEEHRASDVNVMMRSEITGVDGAAIAAFWVYGVENAVVVQCGNDTPVSIHSVTGKLVQQFVAKAGKSVVALPAGAYVINRTKVIVK